MISKGNDVKFARFVLLASVTKQKYDFQVCFVNRPWPGKTSGKYLETRTHKKQKGRRSWQRSCLLITWKRKNWENLYIGIFTRLEINYQFHLLSRPFFLGQCIIKQLLDSVFVISRIISPRLRRITPISTLIILDIYTFIIHSTHYLFSDWLKAYSEFSKSAPGTSSSCRLYNNHVQDTHGHG